MRVTKTIKPGQNGSQRFVRQYGKNLVTVRYREDTAKRSLYTTVEIIVDHRDMLPGINTASLTKFENNKWVALKIAFREAELRQRAKMIGAQWSVKYKVWVMLHQQAVELGIADRVVPNLAAKIDDIDLYT